MVWACPGQGRQPEEQGMPSDTSPHTRAGARWWLSTDSSPGWDGLCLSQSCRQPRQPRCSSSAPRNPWHAAWLGCTEGLWAGLGLAASPAQPGMCNRATPAPAWPLWETHSSSRAAWELGCAAFSYFHIKGVKCTGVFPFFCTQVWSPCPELSDLPRAFSSPHSTSPTPSIPGSL